MRIAVMGAGAIGCFVGGRLALAGNEVTLVGRPRVVAPITEHGLVLEDLEGSPRRVPAGALRAVDARELGDVELVLFATKSRDTRAAAEALVASLPRGAAVVSLQNGVENPRVLASVLGPARTFGGSVSWNVVWRDDERAPTLRRSTSGPLVIEQRARDDAGDALVRALRAAELDARGHPEIERVLHTKLLFNVNNAVNALSGLTLREQLADRRFRRLMASVIGEGLACMRAANIRPMRLGLLDPRLASIVLPAPDLVFRTVARSMIRVDPEARSSMADDLARGRLTEVDDLNGAIVRLGDEQGVPTPINARIVALVHDAERAAKGSPRLTPDAFYA